MEIYLKNVNLLVVLEQQVAETSVVIGVGAIRICQHIEQTLKIGLIKYKKTLKNIVINFKFLQSAARAVPG